MRTYLRNHFIQSPMPYSPFCIVQPAEPLNSLLFKTTLCNIEWFLFLVFLTHEVKSTFFWFRHVNSVFFLLYSEPSNICKLLIVLANRLNIPSFLFIIWHAECSYECCIF